MSAEQFVPSAIGVAMLAALFLWIRLSLSGFLGKRGMIPALLLLGITTGCLGISGGGPVTPSDAGAGSLASPSPPRSAVPAPAQTDDAVKELVARMDVDEKLGQMVIVGLSGTEMDARAAEMIRRQRVGGFILYQPNMRDPQQVWKLADALKQENKRYNRDAPLFLSLDEEGGRVARMPEPLPRFPSARKVGKTNDPAYAKRVAEAIAEELKAYGFNMDYYPVLDVDSNPANPVIGDRAYGVDAASVIRMAIPAMKGMQERQIVPVVKHFPGHGDTSVDSHIGLPVVPHDKERLRRVELAPFAEAVRSGADAVMVGHLLLPKLDARYPASLSQAVMTDWLRGELGFQGVIVTDDLTMGAISSQYDIGAAAVRSVQSGADILLIGHEHEKQMAVLQALRQAVKDQSISLERINRSAERVLKLKKNYGISDESVATPDLHTLSERIANKLKLAK